MADSNGVPAVLLPFMAEIKPLTLFEDSEVTVRLLGAIRESVTIDPEPDLSTQAARKAVASEAFKVRRAKAYLDGEGKQLVADAKARIKVVDQNRKLLRDGCDALATEIRAPLAAWEEEDKARQEAEQIAAKVERCHEIALAENRTFDLEREQARREAEERRLEQEQRQKEEDKRRAKELAEKQVREAQEAAAQAEREKIAAEARAEERARLEKEREEREKQEAAERAEREKQEALEQERARVAAEREAQEAEERRQREAEERRQADEAHRAIIRQQAVEDLVDAGMEAELAEVVVAVIDAGKIRHVSIVY